jgi:hypothetical protein
MCVACPCADADDFSPMILLYDDEKLSASAPRQATHTGCCNFYGRCNYKYSTVHTSKIEMSCICT